MTRYRSHNVECPRHYVGDFDTGEACTCGIAAERKAQKDAEKLAKASVLTREGIQLIALPTPVVKELVEAREALHSSDEEPNPGAAQRRMLRDKKAMEAVCERVRKDYRP